MNSPEEKLDDCSFWSSTRRSPDSCADQLAVYNQLLRELSLFVTQKEESYSKLPQKKKTKVEVSADAERLLRDAVAAFSDARPPTNFVVYEDSSENENAVADGPPVFDGSVANATPQTGGAGTILHLACALDEPLCLAFGLAMGADARASHTAFRRLMIHEAACNGSIQCLTLLLELGRLYGNNTAQDNDADAKLPPRLSRNARAYELPFLPRRLDRSEVLAPLHMYVMQGPPNGSANPRALFLQMERNSTRSSPSSLGKKKIVATNSTDFLTLLQSFRTYARQVKNGELSELDAARKVLQLATLSDASKLSLARSCTFDQQPVLPEFTLRQRGRYPTNNNSDGHGNTPLHWAAFKNETECVSLLLSYGANPNARAHPSGWTPLHDAAYSNSTEAVQLLIDAGAEVDARANSGATPLCFAAQEDSATSAELLLRRGADLTARCAGGPMEAHGQSRFSGYTPLHYCAHYNAKASARILLKHFTAHVAMEIPDLNDRLPIHVAVARGSSAVLQELLHAGARVVTRTLREPSSPESLSTRSILTSPSIPAPVTAEPLTPSQRVGSGGSVVVVSTPVSSPVLRSMIPSQPVTSSKPWNCLTQQSIDECRELIHQAELNWTRERNVLFTPADRRAVMALLMTGKRLEQSHQIFLDLWPLILSFCGRGWFDPIDPCLTPTVILPHPTTTPTTTSALYYNAQDVASEAYDESLSLPNL